jgi:ATP-dependent DNA ligase
MRYTPEVPAVAKDKRFGWVGLIVDERAMPRKQNRRAAQDVARASPPRTSPAFITPMAAHIVGELPQGSEWMYELKLDG